MKVIRIGVKLHDIEVIDVKGTLKCYQDLVEGYIEPAAPIQLRAAGIELLANEEGLIRGLEVNANLFPFFYVGTCVLVGVDELADDFLSLTDDQIKFALEWLKELDGEICEGKKK